MSVEVDGIEVAAAGTVLGACRAAGADVPVLCHDDRVPGSGGHCRACVVEVDGRPVAACTTPARAGARIVTTSPRLDAYRRDLGELMTAEARLDGHAAAVARRWGVAGDRYAAAATDARPADASHPYLRLDPDRCIRCRLCEAACGGVQGRFVFAFTGRGATTTLDWGGGAFATSACVSCGACTAVCPTGAVSDVDRERAAAATAAAEPSGSRTVRTTCGYCGVGCQLDVHVVADRVVRIEGGDGEPNHGHLCVKGRYAHGYLDHPDRLRTPLVRKGGELVPCTWDEAIAAVAAGLRAAGPAVGALSSSRCTNEENYLVQKWLRGGLGVNNVDCCARVCHGPSARGMRESLGTGAATNAFADVDLADVLLVVGANVTESHPVVGARVIRAALRGAHLVVIDPRRTELATLADLHLQLRPGTNVLVLASLAHVIVEEGLHDGRFIAERTEGWDAYRASLADAAPERTEAVTGVPAALVRRAARLYATAARPMQLHGLGITEHYQGSEAVMQLCNLALLVGALGKGGVGVNPLRGQNNVQGAADMGCQPDLVTGYGDLGDPAVQARFAEVWGRPLPTAIGLDIPGMYDAARDRRLRALYILGEDVVQTDPGVHVAGALEALDFLVVQELFLSETARRADVVLPGAACFEKDGTFTNGERRVQRVRAAVPPPAGARPDWQILCDLMAATGWPQPFTSPADVYDEIARVAPAFAGISHARLERGGLQWPVPDRTHPGTPVLHRGRPTRPFRFARIAFEPSPTLAEHDDAYPLRLVTGRVLEHYNAGTMTRRTDSVRLVDRDELELCASDATRLGITDGALVIVESPWGAARARARISARIAAGSAFLAFHFPETGTNQVIGPVLDRLARCPEYKVTPVRVRLA